ncbi:MAG: hypothetical protein JWM20_862 [Patescibacteria group bacterium]|nr:hypothetical protein [Patescibacteria group bacterium]
MKKLAIFSLAIAIVAFGAAHAHAETISADATVSAPETTVSTETSADPVAQMTAQLVTLKKQEADPSIGAFSKFFIHLKVRELENKLNLKKALN